MSHHVMGIPGHPSPPAPAANSQGLRHIRLALANAAINQHLYWGGKLLIEISTESVLDQDLKGQTNTREWKITLQHKYLSNFIIAIEIIVKKDIRLARKLKQRIIICDNTANIKDRRWGPPPPNRHTLTQQRNRCGPREKTIPPWYI